MGRQSNPPGPGYQRVPAGINSRGEPYKAHWRPPCPGREEDHDWIHPHERDGIAVGGFWRRRATSEVDPNEGDERPRLRVAPPSASQARFDSRGLAGTLGQEQARLARAPRPSSAREQPPGLTPASTDSFEVPWPSEEDALDVDTTSVRHLAEEEIETAPLRLVRKEGPDSEP